MSEQPVTRAEFGQLAADVDALAARVAEVEDELHIDPPPPDPNPAPLPLRFNGVPLYGVNWATLAFLTNAGKVLTHITAGRDNTDTSGAGPWSGPVPIGETEARFLKLRPGSAYNLFVTAGYTDGTTETITALVHIPSITPTPTPIPPPGPWAGRTVPLAGRSGQPFNVTAFNGADTDLTGLSAVARRLGLPGLDGGLTFVTRDRGWDAARDTQLAAKARAILDAGGIVIWSMPHCLENDAFMNQNGAKNQYRAQQKAFAAWMADQGLNRPGMFVRFDWESNGNWYRWSAGAPGGIPALRESMGNAIDNFRDGGLDEVGFDLCLNEPATVNVTWLQLCRPDRKDYSVFSIDQYDQWEGFRTQAAWDAKMKASVQSLRGCINQAKQYGCMAGVDESGPVHKSFGAGDNPQYFRSLLGELMPVAEMIAWFNIFNHIGAPPDMFHDIPHNPRAFDVLAGLFAANRVS